MSNVTTRTGIAHADQVLATLRAAGIAHLARFGSVTCGADEVDSERDRLRAF